MKKELIELQFECPATCVVILDQDYQKLGPTVFMEGDRSDASLYACRFENPIFKEKLEKMANQYEKVYFVLRHIEKLEEEKQKRYIALIKDREFVGYELPTNVLIVLTVEKEEDIKKITPELYHFCVVAL